MDYSKLMQNLTAEMKKGVQYQRIPSPFKIFAIIAMIPLIVSFVLSKFGYSVTLFFYKMISAPAGYLHEWLRGQKDEVHHATQAVLYFVCLPTIFSLQVLLSFSAFVFYFQWFFIMIQAYLLTLGGIKWQPYITDATFDDDAEYECKPGAIGVTVFSCLSFGSLAIWLLTAVIKGMLNNPFSGFYSFISVLGTIFIVIYLITVCIVNPIMFKRVPKK